MNNQQILEQIKANPTGFEGKVFLAECQFHADESVESLQLPVKILEINYHWVKVEPDDKTSAEAEKLQQCWWGNCNDPNDFSEFLILDSLFDANVGCTVYCKFLHWVE